MFSLLESVWNLLQNPYDIIHLTLGSAKILKIGLDLTKFHTIKWWELFETQCSCGRHSPQVKGVVLTWAYRTGCSSLFLRPLSQCGYITESMWCDAWLVWRHTYGYLPVQRTLPLPLGRNSFSIPLRVGACMVCPPTNLFCLTLLIWIFKLFNLSVCC